ncbi:MAG: hypothetical protein ACR2H2_11935 [Solirubrobacteraceae bacterium]
MSRAIAAALAAATLLAGCGGDGEPKTVTKERYVAEGDNVCARLGDRFARAGATDPQTPQQIAESADVLADLYGKLLDGLQDITLPTDPADRRGAEAYVAAVRRTDPLLAGLRSSAQRFVTAAGAADTRELTQAGIAVRAALDALRAAQAQADGRALDYGFNYCGTLH